MAATGALALAPAARADTVTLGSTAGSPTVNICSAGIECTYLPFSNVYTPGLVVPYDGTITSFSINSGSSSGTVKLRVLRPAAGGRFTGVEPRPLIMPPAHPVLVDALAVDARLPQGVDLQVEHLAAVGLRHPRVAEQHGGGSS